MSTPGARTAPRPVIITALGLALGDISLIISSLLIVLSIKYMELLLLGRPMVAERRTARALPLGEGR